MVKLLRERCYANCSTPGPLGQATLPSGAGASGRIAAGRLECTAARYYLVHPWHTMLERPPKPPPPPQRASNSLLTVIMLLVIGTICAGTLLMLPTGFIGPVVVFGSLLFFGMIGFHYVVWGRWMTQVLREEALREEQDD